MSRGWPRIGMLARAWTFLVLAAFVVRAAVPAGYMTEVDGNSGKLSVVMCTADGTHSKSVAIEIPIDKPAKQQADKDCPYAIAKFAGLPPHHAIAQAAEAYVYAAALTETVSAPVADALLAHAPPTGPPTLI